MDWTGSVSKTGLLTVGSGWTSACCWTWTGQTGPEPDVGRTEDFAVSASDSEQLSSNLLGEVGMAHACVSSAASSLRFKSIALSSSPNTPLDSKSSPFLWSPFDRGKCSVFSFYWKIYEKALDLSCTPARFFVFNFGFSVWLALLENTGAVS